MEARFVVSGAEAGVWRPGWTSPTLRNGGCDASTVSRLRRGTDAIFHYMDGIGTAPDKEGRPGRAVEI